MVEPIMFVGLGFLAASLLALVIVPLDLLKKFAVDLN